MIDIRKVVRILCGTSRSEHTYPVRADIGVCILKFNEFHTLYKT
jgi:hypothetical protein